MEGVVWGSIAGVAFGLFQAITRRANREADPFLATFTLILTSLVVVATFAVLIEEPSRLLEAPVSALISFALAGVANFFLGWTFLSLAQQRIGASRTSVVAGTAPLFGTALGFVVIGETVHPIALLGVILVVVGVGVLASTKSTPLPGASTWAGLTFSLLTAIVWGATAVFARHGLDQVAMPLSGVSVGIAASAVMYGIGLVVRRVQQQQRATALPRETIVLLVVAGLFVATAIGTQWIALGLAPIAIVLALNQLAVPVVLFVAPVIVGTRGERLTKQARIGTVIVVAGTLLIIAARSNPPA